MTTEQKLQEQIQTAEVQEFLNKAFAPDGSTDDFDKDDVIDQEALMADRENTQRELIANVFSKTNNIYGQWMPQQYVSIFIDELFKEHNVNIYKKEKK